MSEPSLDYCYSYWSEIGSSVITPWLRLCCSLSAAFGHLRKCCQANVMSFSCAVDCFCDCRDGTALSCQIQAGL